MSRLIGYLTALILVASLGMVVAQQKAPDDFTYDAKMGKVTFSHAKHLAKTGGKCETCHPKLFKQAKGNLGDYKQGMHKKAEASKTACAACHVEGGTAFATKGNCKNCHVK